MADPRGFLSFEREGPTRRPVTERLRDWREVYVPFAGDQLRVQARALHGLRDPVLPRGLPARQPHPGVERPRLARTTWREAADRLHATNNFPEFTGRLCPAPCEGACVLGINAEPVSIKQVELEIAEWAATAGSRSRSAVAGDGPARRRRRLGSRGSGRRPAADPGGPRRSSVFERAETLGRPPPLRRAGVQAREGGHRPSARADAGRGHPLPGTGTAVGGGGLDEVPGAAAPDAEVRSRDELRADLRRGRARHRLDPAARPAGPGSGSRRIHFAMDYLRARTLSARAGSPTADRRGGQARRHHRRRRHGADCLGTVHRQGAVSVHQLEILPEPPDPVRPDNPGRRGRVTFAPRRRPRGRRRAAVPVPPRFSTTARRGGERSRLDAVRIVDGRLRARRGHRLEIEAELVLLALGFVGPATGRRRRARAGPRRARERRRRRHYMTSVDGVFACGDMARGQSLSSGRSPRAVRRGGGRRLPDGVDRPAGPASARGGGARLRSV